MTQKIRGFFESELCRFLLGLVLFIFAVSFDFFNFDVVSKIFYVCALLAAGLAVFLSALKGIVRRDLLDEKFLMSVASVGAMIIGDMSEGVAVMLFFLLGEIFEHKAVRKSRNSIRSLMSIRPDEATVIIDGREEVTDAEDVEVGSEIIIKAGERVPIDSRVIFGSADLDTSMLTGESLPRAIGEGDFIESGSIVLNGVIRARTEKLSDESSAQRILELVENATENKSREENFITVFSRVYTPIVVGFAILIALLLPLFVDEITWSDSIYRALTFLVISCPCALVISVPMAFFGGIGGAASEGVLFKGGNVFSALAHTDVFAFDKTGTLTTGEITVEKVIPYNVSESELRYYAASAEYSSTHPISAALRSLSEHRRAPEKTQEIAGKGIVATLDGKEILVGNSALLSDFSVAVPKDAQKGIFVSVGGRFIGTLVVGDKVKIDAGCVIEKLKKCGVKKTVMLSGDRREKAESVAKIVGIDEVYSELLPENKYDKLREIINSSNKTAFVGDGINDSPALAVSDVGIAMGGIGSDSAIEAADIVIMADELSKIPVAVSVAKKTIRIAKENIVFALGIKLSILILSALGYANMWLAVFADVGVAILAILNSMRAMRVKK